MWRRKIMVSTENDLHPEVGNAFSYFNEPKWPSKFPPVMTSRMFFDYALWCYQLENWPARKTLNAPPCPTIGVVYSLSQILGYGWTRSLTLGTIGMYSEFIGHALADEGL
jgi:hypothetical protein